MDENCVVEEESDHRCVTTDEVDLKVEEEMEESDCPLSDRHTDCWASQEMSDGLLDESGETEHLGTCNYDEVNERRDRDEETENDEHMLEDDEGITDRNQEEEDRATSRTSSEIWEELQDVICEVIEDEEREGVDEEEQKGSAEEVEEEGKKESEEDLMETTEEKPPDAEMLQECEEIKTYLQPPDRGEPENDDTERSDGQLRSPPSVPEEVKPEPRKCEESDIILRGVERKLVTSKSPKVYQARAVPVVPPKPQHCKITALSLRQQQNTLRVLAEQDKDQGRDGGEARDANRNSPLSMCFDEAVAKATMRREKEKECEKERQREWGSELQ